MAYDGTIKIDTALDSSGIEKGLTGLKNAAMAGAAAVGAALIGMGAAAVKVGSDFESAMSQVAATMGTTVDKIPELTAAAKEMGATTQFSATQAAEALNYMALAGFDSEKSIAALPKVLDLAAAGGMDLAYASDLVTDSMGALGLETKDLDVFVDQMAKTSQKSNTSVSQLGEAILTVGGTAKTLAGGTVELNTALGIFADIGIKGSEGGTALRNVILALTPTTDKAKAAFDDFGISAYDANGNMRPIQDTMADINAALSTMTDEEKRQWLNNVFNRNDLKAVSGLLAATATGAEELSFVLGNAFEIEIGADAINKYAKTLKEADGELKVAEQLTKEYNLTSEETASVMEMIDASVNRTGTKFEELGGHIRNADGAASAMAKTMLDNLNGDITILQSTLEGLGIAVYEGLNVPLREAAQGATKAVSSILSSLEGGNLKPAIEKIGNAFSDLVTTIIDIAAKVLPMFIESIAFVIENSEILISVLSGLAAAYIALKIVDTLSNSFKVMERVMTAIDVSGKALIITTNAQTMSQAAQNGALTIGQAIIGVLTGKISLLAVAQGIATAAAGAFNAVWVANPIGVVVAAVVALAVGIGVLVSKLNYASEESKKLNKEAQNLKSSTDDLIGSIDQTSKAYEENKNKVEQSATVARSLIDEIYALSEAENKNAAQKAELSYLVDTLNSTMPELGLEYDRHNDKLNQAEASTRALVEAKLAELDAKAEEAHYTKIREEQVAVEQQLFDVQTKMAESKRELVELENELATASLWDRKGINDSINETSKSIKTLEEEETKLIAKQEESSISVEAMSERMQESSEKRIQSEEEIAKAAEDSATSQIDSMGKLIEGNEQIGESYKIYSDAALNTFDKIEKKSGQSVGELTKNLESNQKTVDEWSKNLDALAKRGVDQGLLETLRKAGPESAKTVANLVKASDDELVKLSDTFANGSKVATEALQRELGLYADTDPGGKLVDELSTGVDNNKALEESSKRLIDNSKTAASTSVTTNNFPSVGLNITDGIAKGINQGSTKVEIAVSGVAKRALKRAQDELGIKSPSTEFRDKIGKMIPDGLAIGIEKGSSKAEKAAADMASKTFGKVKTMLSDAQKSEVLNASELVDLWEFTASRYAEGTDMRMKADAELNKARAIHFDEEKARIEDLKKLGQITAAEEVVLYGELASNYADGTNAKMEADQAFYKAHEQIVNQIEKLEQDYLKALDDRTAQIVNFAGMFDEAVVKSFEGSKLMENLQSQVDVLKSWMGDIQQLTNRGLDEGFIKELQAMGPKSAGEIKALTQMSDSELQKYVELWKEKNALAREQATTELEGLKTDTESKIKELIKGAEQYFPQWSQAGESSIKNYRQGFEKDAANVRAAAKKTMVDAPLTELKNAKGSHEAAGKDNTKIYGVGLGSHVQEIKDTAKHSIVDPAISAFTQSKSQFISAGSDSMAGFIEGMKSKGSELAEVAKQLAQSAYEAARIALDTHSPSKKFYYLGEMSAKGYENALTDGKPSVTKSIKDMLQSAYDAANAAQITQSKLVASNSSIALPSMCSDQSQGSKIDTLEVKQTINIYGLPSDADISYTARKLGQYTSNDLRSRGIT